MLELNSRQGNSCFKLLSFFTMYQHEDWDWVEAEANDIALIMLSDVVDLDDPFCRSC